MSNEKEQDMSNDRDIPRAEVERVRDELSEVVRQCAIYESAGRYGIAIGVRKLNALLTEHEVDKKGGEFDTKQEANACCKDSA